MNRRRLTLLSVTIALLLTVALLSSFLLSGWLSPGRASIELPPRTVESGAPIGSARPGPLISADPQVPLELDVSTARRVIATLRRPADYYCKIQTRTYWPGGETSEIFILAVRGPEIHIGHQNTSGSTDYIIRCDGERFALSMGEVESTPIMRGAFSLDDLCGAPTYEDLVSLPDGAITEIGYQNGESGRFLTVRTFESPYIGEYFVNADTGLLQQAIFRNPDGERDIAIQMDMTEYTLGDPGDEYFTPIGR
ncbi:MAG: hypothetical protein LBR85_06965 [Oscillospiraceae bacterium]|jgi:hypothetical protein|nr:hypothetical protein [Oscillospiraceae bacterium]